MRTLLLGLVIFLIAGRVPSATFPDLDYSATYWTFPDPPFPPEIEELGDVFKNPELLRQLKGKPLHQTFWKLNEFLHLDQPAYRDVAPIAAELLFFHPDLEDYLKDRLTRLNDANARRRVDPEFAQRTIDGGIREKLKIYTAIASRVPGDGAFRLVGPQLFADDVDIDYGDALDSSPADIGRRFLRRLVVDRLPGEVLPESLSEARKWWKLHQQRFAKKTPNTATEIYAAPQSATRQPNSFEEPSQPIPQGPSMIIAEIGSWMLAIAVPLAAGVYLLRFVFTRRAKTGFPNSKGPK